MDLFQQDKLFLSASFQNYFKSSPQSLVIRADAPYFTILAASDNYLALIYKRRVDLLNRPLFEVFPGSLSDPEEQSLVHDSFLRVIESGQKDILPVFKYEFEAEAGRQVRYWSNCNEPVLDENGKVTHLINTTRNITTEMLSKQALNENLELKAYLEMQEAVNAKLVQTEQRLRHILDATAEGIAIVDLTGNIVYANELAKSIANVEKQELLQLKNTSPLWNNRRLDGSPLPDAEHPIGMTIATGEPVYNFEYLIQDHKATSKYLQMNTMPLKNEGGIITRRDLQLFRYHGAVPAATRDRGYERAHDHGN